MSPEAARIREDLLFIQARIDMWEEDVRSNLRPVNFEAPKQAVRRALRNLNFIDVDQRDFPDA